jgi:hypothetical protein
VAQQQPQAADPKQIDPSLDAVQKKAQETQEGKTGTVEPTALLPSVKPLDTAVFINGALAVPGAPTEGQTVPSKFSARNAALDKLSIMEWATATTTGQKQ